MLTKASSSSLLNDEEEGRVANTKKPEELEPPFRSAVWEGKREDP
jgi:hypothetical protein